MNYDKKDFICTLFDGLFAMNIMHSYLILYRKKIEEGRLSSFILNYPCFFFFNFMLLSIATNLIYLDCLIPST